MALYIKEANAMLMGMVKQMPNPKLNVPLYEEVLAGFKEEDYLRLAERWKEGKFYFPIIVENMGKEIIDEHKVMKVGESIGVEYFQHCRLTDPETGEEYVTPIKYLVLDIPGRRLIQHISDKMSTAENNRVTDHLAGQATGVSKASSISSPELNVMNAKGLTYGPLEMMKVRGGDAAAFDAALRSIEETGSFSMDAVSQLGTKPKVVESLHELLLGTGIDTNLRGIG